LTSVRVFLDANVLFSAAYRADSGLIRLWELESVFLVTSAYAVAESKANLEHSEQRIRLDRLLKSIEVVDYIPGKQDPPKEVNLPEKDEPILLGAINAKADYLLTGDIRHFGAYFGKVIEGVKILRPAEFLDINR